MPKKPKLAPSAVIGRYAPSPTGDLHLGNLRTALVAWLHARCHDGKFLMRIEDIDTPRMVVGSDTRILKDLEWLGLDWDGEVTYQSQRSELYRAAIEDLLAQDMAYPCFCSRKDIRQASSAPHLHLGIYPGTCAQLTPHQVSQKSGLKSPALRVRVPKDLQQLSGDFVMHRADGLFAYQLAVVVDDLDQGITDVVRGKDLADSTARQLFLAKLLSRQDSPTRYHHVPLMQDENGNKMSKRDGSYSAQDWRDNGGTAESLLATFVRSLGLPLGQSTMQESVSVDDLVALVNEWGFDRLLDDTHTEALNVEL